MAELRGAIDAGRLPEVSARLTRRRRAAPYFVYWLIRLVNLWKAVVEVVSDDVAGLDHRRAPRWWQITTATTTATMTSDRARRRARAPAAPTLAGGPSRPGRRRTAADRRVASERPWAEGGGAGPGHGGVARARGDPGGLGRGAGAAAGHLRGPGAGALPPELGGAIPRSSVAERLGEVSASRGRSSWSIDSGTRHRLGQLRRDVGR